MIEPEKPRISTVEIVFALLALVILWKTIYYPNHRLGCDGWGEYRKVGP